MLGGTSEEQILNLTLAHKFKHSQQYYYRTFERHETNEEANNQ